MEKCPICKQLGYSHAPDGRCDACAEEHGCDCGCFPSPVLQIWAEFCADGEHVSYEREDDGRWIASYFNNQSGRQVEML